MEYVQLGRLGVRVSRICLGVAFRGQPDDGIAAIGSGGAYALAAARALVRDKNLSAREISEQALEIAAGICIHTNERISVEEIGA